MHITSVDLFAVPHSCRFVMPINIYTVLLSSGNTKQRLEASSKFMIDNGFLLFGLWCLEFHNRKKAICLVWNSDTHVFHMGGANNYLLVPLIPKGTTKNDKNTIYITD